MKDADVDRVVEMFREMHAHTVEEGREIRGGTTDHAADYTTLGSTRLQSEGLYERWWNDRSFERATTEIYAIENNEGAGHV